VIHPLSLSQAKSKKYKKPYGVGILDIHAKIDGKTLLWHRAWSNMLMRAYSAEYQARRPTYVGCSVVPEWLTASCFKKWFDKNYVPGYQLDKDILVLGNKVYGPKTCCYVPSKINSVFSEGKVGAHAQGAHWDKSRGRFLAHVLNGYKTVSLGCHTTEKSAHEAWLHAKREIVKNLAVGCLSRGEISRKVYRAVMYRMSLLV
jgi:hypothetical protein